MTGEGPNFEPVYEDDCTLAPTPSMALTMRFKQLGIARGTQPVGTTVDASCGEGASPLLIYSLGHLLKQSYEDKSLEELFESKAFAVKVSYDDGNTKYLAECTILYRHWKNIVRMGAVRYKRLKS